MKNFKTFLDESFKIGDRVNVVVRGDQYGFIGKIRQVGKGKKKGAYTVSFKVNGKEEVISFDDDELEKM